MKLMRWVRQHKTAIAVVLGVIALLIVAGIWFWGVLVGYVSPKTAGERKDVVQTFALIAAGLVGVIGGIVGIANLKQQRDLEKQRTQEDALQAYFEQMGKLLTDYDLFEPKRAEVRHLARAQTLTVLARLKLNGALKGSVVRYLQEAELIQQENPIIYLGDADLSQSNLENMKLIKAMLSEVNLRKANLRGAKLINGTDLSEADLEEADLTDAILDYHASRSPSGVAATSEPDDATYDVKATHLIGTNLKGANLYNAKLTDEQLREAGSLERAIMPNGQKYEDWLKDKEDGKNE